MARREAELGGGGVLSCASRAALLVALLLCQMNYLGKCKLRGCSIELR